MAKCFRENWQQLQPQASRAGALQRSLQTMRNAARRLNCGIIN
jgi:hypothetical protein